MAQNVSGRAEEWEAVYRIAAADMIETRVPMVVLVLDENHPAKTIASIVADRPIQIN